ncbi:ABC transporter substrate-binding protein [Gorillibacterium timonense]|uniref:ABC transporter substrate-binding protein n=1 Tax=Gorillibacterium timonense TaxID=1689269 RepID=UPI00071C521F|nr:ABC transporter substrate-binding protein [Gorillibacterium timonense]
MKRIQTSLFVVVMMLTLTALSGCSSSDQAQPSATASQKPTAKLSIMLDWYPNAVHSFLYLAEEKGIFAAHGLDVHMEMPSDTNDALKLAAAGKVDLALSYQPQVLMARGEGIPVKAIASIVRHPLNHLMVLADSGIARPKDLVGKNVGFSSIPLYEAMIKTMVTADGGDPEQVTLTDVGFSLIPALAAKQTDAIMGGFINHEKLLLEKEGHPVIAMDPTRYGVPDYSELVLIASEDGIKKKEAELKSFLAAIREAEEQVAQDPDAALAILLKHEDKTSPLDKDIEAKSLQLLQPLMTEPGVPFGQQSADSWNAVHRWLAENKLIPDTVQAADAYVIW